jgi:hypothetical protein
MNEVHGPELPAWLRHTIAALADRGDLDGIRAIVGAYLRAEQVIR